MPSKHNQKSAVLLLISAVALPNNKSIPNWKIFTAPERCNNYVCMYLTPSKWRQ